MSVEATCIAELKRAGLSDDLVARLVEAAKTDEVKTALRNATEDAVAKGCFGGASSIFLILILTRHC